MIFSNPLMCNKTPKSLWIKTRICYFLWFLWVGWTQLSGCLSQVALSDGHDKGAFHLAAGLSCRTGLQDWAAGLGAQKGSSRALRPSIHPGGCFLTTGLTWFSSQHNGRHQGRHSTYIAAQYSQCEIESFSYSIGTSTIYWPKPVRRPA